MESAKFLIAHNDTFTTRALEIALREGHHNSRVTHEGLDVIDRALDEKPDAIILGMDLPGLNGLDVARALRALEPTRKIPILLLVHDAEEAAHVGRSGLPMIDSMVGPFELGRFRDYLTKLLRAKLPVPEHRELDPDRELAAISDPLTGLYERHYLLHRLAYEGARSARYKFGLACILLGVHDYEKLVDIIGPLGRDRMLVEIANILRRAARVTDVIGRAGEDEFLLIAPHTAGAGAQQLAQRLQQRMREFAFDLPTKVASVSPALGVAATSGTSIAENLALFGRAEAALIRARSEDDGIVVG